MARATSPLAAQLGEPGWLASLLFAAVATVLVCYPAWPGFMSYDSLFAYQQARYGVQTMLWPPLHTYMFQASERLGASTWGVFVFQTATLFASAAVVLHLLVRNRAVAFLLCVGFAALIALSPAVLGPMLAHWRDVPTASFAFLGLALWLLAARYGQPLLLAPAILAFGCAVALRYNAFVLVAFLLALMIWSPLLGRPARFARPFVVVCVVGALGLAWASTQWRLPDLLRMPAPASLGGTQEFDLIGVSACADTNYLPQGIAPPGTSGYHLRKAYDPRHLHMTLAKRPGVPALVEGEAGGQVQSAWLTVILKEPGCYLSHRTAVFVEQMGMARDGVFYPTHAGIDANSFGLTLAHPDHSAKVVQHILDAQPSLWTRPFWLYVLALGLGGMAALRERAYAPLLLAMLAGVFAYPALLFVASPAADARYIFPSNVLGALVALSSLGLLIARPGRR